MARDNKPEVELRQSFSQDADDKLGRARGQKLDDGGMRGLQVTVLAPLFHAFWHDVVWTNDLDLRHLTIRMKKG